MKAQGVDSPPGGQEDELRIEASLGVLRGDVFERIPASDPALLEQGGNFLTDAEYDQYQFHDDWIRTAPLLAK